MTYKAEVMTRGTREWRGNELIFETRAEAQDYAIDLARRWTLVVDWRVIEVSEERK